MAEWQNRLLGSTDSHPALGAISKVDLLTQRERFEKKVRGCVKPHIQHGFLHGKMLMSGLGTHYCKLVLFVP